MLKGNQMKKLCPGGGERAFVGSVEDGTGVCPVCGTRQVCDGEIVLSHWYEIMLSHGRQ